MGNPVSADKIKQVVGRIKTHTAKISRKGNHEKKDFNY